VVSLSLARIEDTIKPPHGERLWQIKANPLPCEEVTGYNAFADIDIRMISVTG
jgi:hypothetical protein